MASTCLLATVARVCLAGCCATTRALMRSTPIASDQGWRSSTQVHSAHLARCLLRGLRATRTRPRGLGLRYNPYAYLVGGPVLDRCGRGRATHLGGGGTLAPPFGLCHRGCPLVCPCKVWRETCEEEARERERERTRRCMARSTILPPSHRSTWVGAAEVAVHT